MTIGRRTQHVDGLSPVVTYERDAILTRKHVAFFGTVREAMAASGVPHRSRRATGSDRDWSASHRVSSAPSQTGDR